MITFLEFYEVLMKFVLFKLYHTQGIRYPPTEDQALKDAGCFLLAIKPAPIDAAAGADVMAGTLGAIDGKMQGESQLCRGDEHVCVSVGVYVCECTRECVCLCVRFCE